MSRPKILSQRRLTLIQGGERYPRNVNRPKTRGDCANGPRPCPFVSCRYHLLLDVNPESGALKVNFPEVAEEGDVGAMLDTCALDVADRPNEATLEDVGDRLNVTRERARQIEARSLGILFDDPTLREFMAKFSIDELPSVMAAVAMSRASGEVYMGPEVEEVEPDVDAIPTAPNWNWGKLGA